MSKIINMKYVAIFLLFFWAVFLFVAQPFSKEPITGETQDIDTIICGIKEYYGEDTIVGDRYLILVEECDTIYKTK